MRPKARSVDVLVTELEEELVIYDERSANAHRLNRTAAFVWRSADGETTVSGIAAKLAAELGGEASDELVETTLEQLEGAGLLDAGPAEGRRRMLKRVAIAAALAPVILSIPAPTAASIRS